MTELFVYQRNQLKDFTVWDVCNLGEDIFSKTSNLFFGNSHFDLFFSDLYFDTFKKLLKEDPKLFIQIFKVVENHFFDNSKKDNKSFYQIGITQIEGKKAFLEAADQAFLINNKEFLSIVDKS